MAAAAADLLALGPVGLQLTPGCAPTRDFETRLVEHRIPTRTHDGFHFSTQRQPVWDGAELLCRADSLHPPTADEVTPDDFLDGAESGRYDGVVLETMYPGHCLGTGPELERAMDLGTPLAVDVSHIHMQLHQEAMTATTWSRLQTYEGIIEIHLSSNDGRRDQHRAVSTATFGFDWAVARAADGIPLIVENYLHRQADDERRRMVDLILHGIEGSPS